MTPFTEEELAQAATAYERLGSQAEVARELGITPDAARRRLLRAAERGMTSRLPVMPGFRISRTTAVLNAEGDLLREFVQQKPDAGDQYEMPSGFALKRDSALLDAEGRRIGGWKISEPARDQQLAAMRAAVDAFKEEIPRADRAPAPLYVEGDLLNQYTVADSHFGMLAWREETGDDYDLRIAEELLRDWFHAAIDSAPRAHTGVFAQLGDLMHHDALESVTPAHRHVLDADSRLQKVIRVVIRVIRHIIDLLLRKHEHVHVVMASGNHDPASSAWLREMLAVMYEHEPRISVDNSPSLYYAYEWGRTALFWHHGHKRNVSNVDAIFAGMFREMFGRCTTAYAHVGHLHSDEGRKTGLMYVERHETLAGKDAYAAGGGWPSGRSAKVITYAKDGGEVFRSTLRPEMVKGRSKLPIAANDNMPASSAAA